MDPISLALGLSQFVPAIAKWITGSDKAADVAGKVIDIAKTVTGTSDAPAAVAAIQADPAKILEFQQAVGAQQADLEKAYLADLDSARKMQIAALGQDDIFSKRFVYYFASAWSVFAMGYFTAITFLRLSVENQRAADTITGVLIGTVLVGIFHYFFGSTAGSLAKSKLLAQSQPTASPQ